MTQQHATRADIEAILEARRKAKVEAPITAQSIPATPSVRTQSVEAPITEPVAPPAPVVPAPVPQASDAEVEAFLDEELPPLINAAVALAAPPFQWSEVTTLGLVVSRAVSRGLPQVKGTEARVLVVIITRLVWRKYATSHLPTAVRPLAGLLETLIVTGIEAAYQLAVKRRG